MRGQLRGESLLKITTALPRRGSQPARHSAPQRGICSTEFESHRDMAILQPLLNVVAVVYGAKVEKLSRGITKAQHRAPGETVP
mgnify:CR=1 FL=1